MLHDLTKQYVSNEKTVKEWIHGLRKQTKGPIYNSVDLRNSGFKISAVDTNIFPAGFNNLCPDYSDKTGRLFKEYLGEYYPQTKKILIFPESHTKNKFYLENVRKLKVILEEIGYQVKVAHINDSLSKKTTLETATGKTIEMSYLERTNNIIHIGKFTPEIILTNNDFSSEIPAILKGLKQPVLPNPKLGWFQRSKYEHFLYYEKLIEEFCAILEIDPWFFTPLTSKVTNINFQNKEGIESAAKASQKLLEKIQNKYDKYGIKETPYIFIKNDSGTYGIAIHHIEKPEEILTMNRKTRNKLSTGKDKTTVTDIIIQEGVPTMERFKGMTGEPVIYLVGNKAAGGFFRLNTEKDERANLNARGAKFTKLCFHEMFGYENSFPEYDLECLERLYFTIAEIASLASGLEMQEVENS